MRWIVAQPGGIMGNPDASRPWAAKPAIRALDPLEMLESARDLVDPATMVRELPWLTGEMMKIAVGRSSISSDKRDPRFTDAAWQGNPFFRLLGQGYRLFEEWLGRMADSADGPWERQARTRYLANIVTAALSPTNFFWTNPLALKLACTPGAVVYRDEIFELLEYAPATPAVRSRPLLMVPPELNRYYVLDLAPGRSMVEFAVAHGIKTFMIVWRNPRAELGHGRWGLDDYLAAHVRAAEVAQKITGSDAVNWLGLCAGGITTALALGHLAAKGDPAAGSATYLVTMLTNAYPNIVGMMDTEASRSMLKRAAASGQVFPGGMVRTNFAWQ